MFKRILKVLLAFVVLLVIAAVLLVNSINSERNKEAIREAVLASTGYELNIAGDMDVNFFPSIGLTLNDVRLKNPSSPQELASTSAVVLQVDVGSLFSGKLLIRELSADDFHINYFVDASGRSIWQVDETGIDALVEEAVAANISTAVSADELSSDIVSISFERIQISNASIDIQDISRGIRYSISKLNLDSRDSNIEGRPFDIDLGFDFISFDNTTGARKTTNIGLKSRIVADLDKGDVNFTDINFSLTPVLLQGQLAVSNLFDELNFEGSLASNDIDMTGLLEALGISEPEKEFTGVTSELPTLAFALNFTGDLNQLNVPELTASFGDTKLQAETTVRFATDFAPMNISYDITTTGIDITPFLSEPEEVSSDGSAGQDGEPAVTSIATTAASEDTELPFDLLNSLNLLGSISIESLTADELYFQNINIFTNAEDGVLDIEIQPVSAFDGTIQGNMRIDGRKADATLTTRLIVSQLNIVDLAPHISGVNSVTGRLDVNADYNATGSSTNALLNSVSGTTTFTITENTVDIGVIKQVFTAITALGPTSETIQQWPDVVQFNELSGYILLEDGIAANQQVRLRMDNVDISGTGGIDLEAATFNYELTFSVLGLPHIQTIKINELYNGVPWPVQCNAGFADEVSQYCRPDFTQVREIFTQIGSNAIRSRLNDAVTDQLPEELRDGVRSLLRNIFN